MTIWIHRYELMPRQPLSGIARAGKREGALLRVDEGFADVHPWPELGDAPLDEQLALLARGETTPLTRASLQMARLDADARRRGVSLFDGLTIPESHWPGPDPPIGFDTVKVKDAAEIPPHVRVRIDFNGRLTPDEFSRVARTLPSERVDFVEDPVDWDEQTWRRLRRATGLRLALDRGAMQEPSPEAVDVVVHKPAISQAFPDVSQPVVVTSYMDHPVGQLGAAWVAASNPTDARCGLATHVLYEPDAFTERLQLDGARLVPPGGTGIGFDDLLEQIPWKVLS
jgi:o-succinylbenzoate synthase